MDEGLALGQMHKTLSSLIHLEKAETHLDYPAYPFKFEEGKAALESKISEIEWLMKQFKETRDSNYKKITSKIYRAYIVSINRTLHLP